MTNAEKLTAWFERFQQKMDSQVPKIVAETAVEVFKESFTSKSFNGLAWPALSANYKPTKGSLMVRSSNLLNSIRPSEVTPGRVVISAGSALVPYARVHNEGLHVEATANVKAFTRKRFTRNEVSAPGARKPKYSITQTGESQVSAHTRQMDYTMPRRQYMGHSAELNKRIIQRLKGVFGK